MAPRQVSLEAKSLLQQKKEASPRRHPGRENIPRPPPAAKNRQTGVTSIHASLLWEVVFGLPSVVDVAPLLSLPWSSRQEGGRPAAGDNSNAACPNSAASGGKERPLSLALHVCGACTWVCEREHGGERSEAVSLFFLELARTRVSLFTIGLSKACLRTMTTTPSQPDLPGLREQTDSGKELAQRQQAPFFLFPRPV